MTDVCDDIGDLAYLAFEGPYRLPPLPEDASPGLGVLHYTFPGLKSEVQSPAAVLYLVNHAETLLVVVEAEG